MPAGGEVVEDYRNTGLSLRNHPASFLREEFRRRRMITCAEAMASRDKRWVEVAGLVLARDRGESVPAVEPGFSAWLRSRGVVGQVLRNRRAQLGRARRLLGGRILADLAAELAALEGTEGFAALSTGVRSDLRAALRLYAEWRTLPPSEPRRARRVEVVPAEEEVAEVRRAA